MRFRTVLPWTLTMLSTIASAKLAYDGPGGPNFVTLQSFGTGSTSFNLRLLCDPVDALVSMTAKGIDERIATRVKFSPTSTKFGYNLTTLIETDGKLGYTSFNIIAKTSRDGMITTHTLPASLDVRGVQFTRNGRPLGGESGNDIEFASYKAAMNGCESFATAYAGRGRQVSIRNCSVSVTETGMQTAAFLHKEDVHIDGNKVKISPRKYRATQGVRVSFECPNIQVNGETAETEVRVSVSPQAPLPPLVVNGMDEWMPYSYTSEGNHGDLCLRLINYEFLKPDSIVLAAGDDDDMFLCQLVSMTKISDMHRACFSLPMDVVDGKYSLKLGMVKDGKRKWAFMEKRLVIDVHDWTEKGRLGRLKDMQANASKWRHLKYSAQPVYHKTKPVPRKVTRRR